MSTDPLETYLASVRPDAQPGVRRLAEAIDAAGAPFDRRFTYGALVYTFEQRWHDWVVAVSVTKKAVNLRFLYGRRMSDPARLMRPGSTTAATIDYPSADDIDPALVTAYVREAVALHPQRPPEAGD
jgi:hypothetical protein